MWHSHEDFIRDIVSLEDADAAETTYKVLQSYGRGIKASEKSKFSDTVDPRTGGPVGLDEYVPETDFDSKTKGRGRLSIYSKSQLLLQKQLRALKPLGSGDEIIEAYCRRNAPAPAPAKPLVASDSASEAGKSGSSPRSSKSDFYSTDTTRRTIACRNSKLQSNALINSLLSKMSIKENGSGDGETDRVGKSIAADGDEDGEDSLTSTFSNAPPDKSSAETDHRKCISKNAIETGENVEQKDFKICDNGKKSSADLRDDFPPLKRH